MLKNHWLLVLVLLILASCSSITGDKPAGTLSESTMGNILVDMQLVESKMRVTTDSLSLIQLRDSVYLRARFAEVFRKNKVTPDEFNSSLDYYIKHIDKLDAIYNNVIATLTELDEKGKTKNKDPKSKSDQQKAKADTLINESNTAKVKKLE